MLKKIIDTGSHNVVMASIGSGGANQAHAIDGFAPEPWLRLWAMRMGGGLTQILCLWF